jgi:D-amino-acid oxidase
MTPVSSRHTDDWPWFATDVLSFKLLPTSSLPEGTRQGQQFNSIMVNVPQYLEYLLSTAESLGATTIRKTLPSSTSLFGTLKAAKELLNSTHISAFVNATGISARQLVPDANVFPVRGQTVTVAGSAKRITTVSHDPKDGNERITYILPRPNTNTTILGGTKQTGDWTAEVNPKDTEGILQRAETFVPELLDDSGKFKVLSVQVGLRPGRNGGARVEIEKIEGFTVCHAYGHAGAG